MIKLDVDVDKFNKLKPKEQNFRLGDLSEYADDWYESILPEKNKIHLGYEKFDNEFKGKLRGQLFVICGYGGTKKSLLAQNISVLNAIEDRSMQ